MEYKTFASAIKGISDRTVTGVASVFGIVDDGGDRVMPGAFSKTAAERLPRVKVLWQHDSSQPPLAVIRSLREIPAVELPEEVRAAYPEATGGLEVVREYLPTQRGDEVLAGLKSGAITEMSFGYDAVKFDLQSVEGKTVRNLREVRLWDVSDVNWGMNPATVAVKAAVPFRDTGKAPEGDPWTGPTLADFTDQVFGDLSAAERRRIMGHFAWSANDPPEAYNDLKLAHHQPAKTGIGPAVWRGVAAAMVALMGGRAPLDVPSGDRRGIYDHLVGHYKQFDKEPPDFKTVELLYQIRGYDAKEGRVLSARNLERLKNALKELEDVLSLAEPQEPEEGAALTALARLAIAEHTLQE